MNSFLSPLVVLIVGAASVASLPAAPSPEQLKQLQALGTVTEQNMKALAPGVRQQLRDPANMAAQRARQTQEVLVDTTTKEFTVFPSSWFESQPPTDAYNRFARGWTSIPANSRQVAPKVFFARTDFAKVYRVVPWPADPVTPKQATALLATNRTAVAAANLGLIFMGRTKSEAQIEATATYEISR